jgi:IclR family pca regulon transcriptional regulator
MSTEMTVPERTSTPSPARFQTSWGSEFAGFEGNPNFVLSLARGLRVIECFEGRTEGLSIPEISLQTGFSRAAVRRLLITLELLGYVEAVGRTYRLRHRILRLGLSYLSSNSLSRLGQPTVHRITEELGEACSVGVLDGDDVLFVAGAVTKRIVAPGSSTGVRIPAYCTSMGRVLLAGLPENEFLGYVDRVERKRLTRKTIVSRGAFIDAVRRVQNDGYAVVDEELELDLRSISVPVLSRLGGVAASLGIATQASRISVREMQERFLPVLKEHAHSIGQFTS